MRKIVIFLMCVVATTLFQSCGSKSSLDASINQVETLLNKAEKEKDKWTDEDWVKFNEQIAESYKAMNEAANDKNVSGLKKIKIAAITLRYVAIAGRHVIDFETANLADNEEELSGINEDEEVDVSTADDEGGKWYSQDFKLKFYFNLAAGMQFGEQAVTSVFIRKGDKLYEYREAAGNSACYLRCMEDDAFVVYTFSPTNKKAMREVKSNVQSFEAGIANVFNDNLSSSFNTQQNTVTKIGTEEVAGIKCNVYKKIAKSNKEVKEMELLAKLAGENAEGLKKLIEEASESYSKVWINSEYPQFIMKKFVHIKLNGKVSDDINWEVKELQFGNFDYSEAVFDLSGYEIM